MSPDKKNEPQFKLNYFDIIKGVLFPQIGKPPVKPATPPQASTPPAAPSPAPAAAKPPVATAQPTPMVSKPPVTTAQPATTQAAPAPQKPEPTAEEKARQREKRMRLMWTIGSVVSIVVNLVLIIIVLVLVNQVFVLKKLVGDQLLGGLYNNFVLMDQAHIKTDITVTDEIPIDFNLLISQDTVVTLTQQTAVNNAMVDYLNTGGLIISNAPADITLPAGAQLPVHLELTVPVKAMIPVKLNVPVDIPLQQTELHQPFVGLQNVVAPYYQMLAPGLQKCNDALPGPLCFFFATP